MKRLSTPPPDDEVENDCAICEGTGEMIIAAHQEAGEIVDEEIVPCVCQKRDEED